MCWLLKNLDFHDNNQLVELGASMEGGTMNANCFEDMLEWLHKNHSGFFEEKNPQVFKKFFWQLEKVKQRISNDFGWEKDIMCHRFIITSSTSHNSRGLESFQDESHMFKRMDSPKKKDSLIVSEGT